MSLSGITITNLKDEVKQNLRKSIKITVYEILNKTYVRSIDYVSTIRYHEIMHETQCGISEKYYLSL